MDKTKIRWARTEMGVTLDGRLHEEFPLPLPRQRDRDRALGRYGPETINAVRS